MELAVQKPPEPREEEGQKENEKKKRHPVLVHALTWKKRLVAARAKRKGGKKVKPVVTEPVHVQREQVATDSRHRALQAVHRHGPIPVPVPTVPEQSENQWRARPDAIISPRRVVVQVGVHMCATWNQLVNFDHKLFIFLSSSRFINTAENNSN